MRDSQDLFPTRLERKLGMFERIDPVVHGDEAQLANGTLDKAQIEEYERDGFLSFDGFFDPDDMQAFIDELRSYEDDADLKLSEGTVLEPGREEIRTVFGIHQVSERFSRLTRDPRLLSIVKQLLGSDVYIHQSRINYKPGFKGKGFDWHSDFETWHSEDGMPRMRALSCSIVLTDNGEFNGPLMLIPGSHRYFVPCVGRTPENNYKESLKSQEVGVPPASSLREIMLENDIQAPKGTADQFVLEWLNRSGRHIHRLNGHFMTTEGGLFTLAAGLYGCQARFKAHWPRQLGPRIVLPAPDCRGQTG